MGRPTGGRVDYGERPMLVFWETTRACAVACRHCRASALTQPLPGQLSPAEGRALVDQVAGFGRPYPILVLTGGDCLLREDLFELVEYATSLGVPTALSPSVTPVLTPAMVQRIATSGVKAVSISLDGASPATHEGVRAIEHHFEDTVAAIRALVDAGLTVQVNTTVMRENLHELADVAALVQDTGAHVWEVFFLVHVGRGVASGAITAEEHEDVCHFLYDASQYGFIVRTVEAPFFRRVVTERRAGGQPPESAVYAGLAQRLTTPARPGPAPAQRAHRGHPGRQGHPVRGPRRRGVPGRVPAAGPGQPAGAPAARDLPRRPAAAPDPGRRVQRPLRVVPLRRPVRRVAGAGVRGHRRPARRGPGLFLRPGGGGPSTLKTRRSGCEGA